MQINWFDSFEPSDWIATGSAGVGLVAIAVPTALFFLERRDRKRSDRATEQANNDRDEAEKQRAASDLANAKTLIDLQQRDLDRQDRRDQEAKDMAVRAQAELFHVWASGYAANSRMHVLNSSKAPVSGVYVRYSTTWWPDHDPTENPEDRRPVKIESSTNFGQVGPTLEGSVTYQLHQTDWRILGSPPADHSLGGIDILWFMFVDANGSWWRRTTEGNQLAQISVQPDTPKS